MVYKLLILERDGPIATITLNRPDVGNAFNIFLMNELDAAIREVGMDSDIRAVIMTGAGKHFSTGIDLSMFADLGKQAAELNEEQRTQAMLDPEDQTYGKGTLIATVFRIRNMNKPVIAAINGAAVGAALGLALACDIMIASDKARFSMVFVKRGIVPDTAGSFTLPRIVGLHRACELTLTGDTIDAAEADRIGLVNRVVPHDDLMKAARELAERIAKNPPLAVGMAKTALHTAMAGTDILEHMQHEVELQKKLLDTEDFMEAATAFLEKREPVFKGK